MYKSLPVITVKSEAGMRCRWTGILDILMHIKEPEAGDLMTWQRSLKM